MGMAIPRDAGGWASGMAAVRKGRMARKKECERNISDREKLGFEKSGRGLKDP